MSPASVAVIGASADATKFGGRALSFLSTEEFRGKVYAVNRAGGTVQGHRAFTSVADIPDIPDAAIIAVPATNVAAAVDDCIAKGIGSAVVFTSGFAEVGPSGASLQEDMVRRARAGRLRLLGPNSIGLVNIAARYGGTFAPSLAGGWGAEGGICIASQSGAVAVYTFVLARERQLGLRSWCATGNEADVDVPDCIAYYARDPGCRVITIYLEGVRDGARLREALEMARRAKKPVVVLKSGSSEVGAEAAQSHTAALAGSDIVFEGLFQQYGAYRARDITELLEVSALAEIGRFPEKRTVSLVSISGGAGVLMADRAAERGVHVPPLSKESRATLDALIPLGNSRNPIDATAQILTDPNLLLQSVRIALSEPGIGATIVFLTGTFAPKAEMKELIALLKQLKPHTYKVPLLLAMQALPDDLRFIRSMGFATFEDPSRAVDGLAALMSFAPAFAYDRETPVEVAPAQLPDRPTERDGLEVLRAAGISTVRAVHASTRSEAVRAASELGFPVALKISSPDIAHKSDVGGVRIGLADAETFAAAYDAIMRDVARRCPQADIDGVLVQSMAPRGIETIIGVKDDPVFGPVVVFGLGGVLSEVFRDVSCRVAPFDLAEARRMVDAIRGRHLLDGFRGTPAADIDAIAHALTRVSAMAHANRGRLQSMDINPFIVGAPGQGGVAADAHIVTQRTEAS